VATAKKKSKSAKAGKSKVKMPAKAKPKAMTKVTAKARPATKINAKAKSKANPQPKMTAAGSASARLTHMLPLNDRLLVKVEGASERTAGGTIIPGTVAERPHQGQVMAVGKGGRNKKGVLRPLDVRVGETVMFSKFAGSTIELSGEEFLILREEDVLGVVTH